MNSDEIAFALGAEKGSIVKHTCFRAMLRGREVDVEMTLLSERPLRFIIIFHGYEPVGRLSPAEIAFLCREAEKADRKGMH